ncbi:phosphoglycerate dehydrogenase [Cytophagales bacterium LB-30]|uniref:D-3-phosphoglycerate dehydrogenase n=1 Tax=Shiella aurantiaca TaxID=3058365 RepID=A0ABT8F1B0_9BACT|nr:phosphoglycerate dehydrogenase [Shiella aurantiaca]MDN4164233.1 phosphoglycerate dehydrogenase [Shiella aurantiaca]
MQKYFIIDFDSTFTRVEALDALCEISLKNSPRKSEVLQEIKSITDLGMDGSITFRESLEKRIELLQAHRDHLPDLVAYLKQNVTPSFHRNKEFLEEHSPFIYIISNGFKDFIVPIVIEYGIRPEHVFANEFEFDENGRIVGFDANNPLSSNNGKVEQIRSLNLSGEVCVIGDGYTDYEIRSAGLAHKFYAFTENVERLKVIEKADHVAPSLDEILFVNNMSKVLSYPKNRIKVLLLENVHADAARLFKDEGYSVETYSAALEEDELCEKIKDVSILGIRSKTLVTAKVIEKANRLVSIGAFCIGTNQIDLNACQERGITVFNAPFSNTRSVVELAIGEIIMLMRNLPDTMAGMHAGKWNKSASNSFEIRGKKLGIIGYGNIGAQLSVVAESIGMKVYYYDHVEKLALGNAVKCTSLAELLRSVDVVSLHVDGRKDNLNLIGEKEFDLMKDGVIFLNLSRGHIVDIEALRKAIEAGKVRGAAVDVFPYEPVSNQEEFMSPLRNLPNTLLTPHIGGSTLEAQINIAHFVPNKIMEYINTGSTTNSVNFPNLQLPILQNAHRLMHIHYNVSGIMAKINQVLAEHNINIVGQYLKTNEKIGYVITDIDKTYNKKVIEDLKKIENTIRFRILY